MKRKHVRIHITLVNIYFNAYFTSTNYKFVMYSACNTVVLVFDTLKRQTPRQHFNRSK